jgi:hypothetical protein
MLVEVGPAADREIIEHADPPALVQQPIDEMASDEAAAAGDQIQFFQCVLRPNRCSARRRHAAASGDRR